MRSGRPLAAGVAALDRFGLTDIWYRVVPVAHAASGLDAAHTSFIASRFNAGAAAARPFQILYFADSPLTALYEVRAIYGGIAGAVPAPVVNAAVQSYRVRLRQVADLTDAGEISRLRTSHQELAGDWAGYRPPAPRDMPARETGIAPTQKLGQAFYDDQGVEAWLYPSARHPGGRCLAILMQRLAAGSDLRATA